MIRRDITINLIGFRRLSGAREEEVRAYILGLCLVAATEPLDPFLRQGCLLVPDSDTPAVATLVERDGQRQAVNMEADVLATWAKEQASAFGVGAARTVAFDAKLAKADMGTKRKK